MNSAFEDELPYKFKGVIAHSGYTLKDSLDVLKL